jgi:DNA modification methylase
MIYNKDAGDVFLDKNSVNLFFMNPPYYESPIEIYGGDPAEHINAAQSNEEYLTRLLPIIKHAEHALAEDGSIFVMLPNDVHNVVLYFRNMVLKETNLKLGKLFIWDFSITPGFDIYDGEKMGIIVHMHKGSPYVKTNFIKYVLPIPFVFSNLDKYRHLGFVENALPTEIYDHFIELFSKPGDVVSDLVGGTGGIIISAKNKGRNYIYNDISESQVEIAKARLLDFENKSSSQ